MHESALGICPRGLDLTTTFFKPVQGSEPSFPTERAPSQGIRHWSRQRWHGHSSNIHKQVIDTAYEVISLKGSTSWEIGYPVASLARSILRDQRKIHPVSVIAKGFYGIDEGEVFLSLPAQLGRGVLGITNVHLTTEEEARFRNSAVTILEVLSQLDL